MSVRVRPGGTEVDRPVLAVAVLAVVVTAVGALWLAASGRDGGRLGLGLVDPQAVTTFEEVVDLGGSWTFVVSYGGQEVWRQEVDGRELAGRGWTVQVPAEVTLALERQGYR